MELMNSTTLIMLGIGILFILIAIAVTLVATARRRRCTTETSATVTNVKSVRLGERSYQVVYRTTYEYYVNGVKYTKVKTTYEKDTPPKESTIFIKYNPNKPQLSQIPATGNEVYEIVALTLACVGLAVVVVSFCATLNLFIL